MSTVHSVLHSRIEPFVEANPSCPVCNAQMRKANKPRGKSGRSHSFSSQEQRYVCSVDEGEVYRDERGHFQRIEGAKHGPGVRHWTREQALRATARPRRLSFDEYVASVQQVTATR